jgi:outer membrane protein
MRLPDRIRAVILLFCMAGGALRTHAGEIAVEIGNAPATGTVVCVLFDSANAFGDLRDPVKTVDFPFDGRAEYRLTDVPPGTYALLVYHDENVNGRVDRNFIGIPREPLGFSNGYRPKGPPSYRRAAFTLQPEQTRRFRMDLRRPLGERGRLGVGIGVIARSSPYRDYDGGVYQVIPAVTYTGERLQIYGPSIQLGLAGSGRLRLAATGEYRIGGYAEDDSDILDGMGDAESTFLAGLALQSEFANGIDLSLGYMHDALDRIGGGEARFELEKSFQYGILRLTPKIGLVWTSSDLAQNDFGVAPGQARPDRPAYAPGDHLTSEAGVGAFIDVTRDWLLVINAGVEFLDSHATRSPIVDQHSVTKGFAALSYVF